MPRHTGKYTYRIKQTARRCRLLCATTTTPPRLIVVWYISSFLILFILGTNESGRFDVRVCGSHESFFASVEVSSGAPPPTCFASRGSEDGGSNVWAVIFLWLHFWCGMFREPFALLVMKEQEAFHWLENRVVLPVGHILLIFFCNENGCFNCWS